VDISGSFELLSKRREGKMGVNQPATRQIFASASGDLIEVRRETPLSRCELLERARSLGSSEILDGELEETG
jgi:hypothetical protein